MDCDMSFAMATFLVKHSARHSLHDHSQNKTRVCPICTLKFDSDAYNAHLKSVHQVDMALEDVKQLDERDELENLMCYLCQKTLEDQESLFLHKRNHLAQKQGSVASCSICDSSFVNAICLEAHMQTHYKLDWKFECKMCRSRFPEDILLKSHTMSHGIPAPAISSVNRYRSQTQDGHRRQQTQTPADCTTPISVNVPSGSTHTNTFTIPSESPLSSQSRDEVTDEAKITTNNSGIPFPIPIQISTSQVTTTQAGTPLAIRTTDANGRNIIQLVPVQLVPISSSCEDNSEVQQDIKYKDTIVSPDTTIAMIPSPPNYRSLEPMKPKTKKKIPDLIPISEYSQCTPQEVNEKPIIGLNLRALHSIKKSSILKNDMIGSPSNYNSSFGYDDKLSEDKNDEVLNPLVSSSGRHEYSVKTELMDTSDVFENDTEADSTTAPAQGDDLATTGTVRVRASGLLANQTGHRTGKSL